ncbi:hypothetical protein IT417_02200 [bacterium]|nr:hypothetical protein [bacterium]
MGKFKSAVIVALLLIVFVAFATILRNNGKNSVIITSNQSQDIETNFQPPSNQNNPNSLCVSNPAPVFTHYPTDISSITVIENPIRILSGQDIKTHAFIEVEKSSPVYAPVDSTLVSGANYIERMGEDPVEEVQYILHFEASCEVGYWLDHIINVPDKIMNAFPPKAQNDTKSIKVDRISVKAGELVGYTNRAGRGRFDMGVINTTAPKTDLVTHPKYKNDPIVKTSDKYQFAVCPFQYFDVNMQNNLKSLFKSEHISKTFIQNLCKDI